MAEVDTSVVNYGQYEIASENGYEFLFPMMDCYAGLGRRQLRDVH